MEQIIELTCEQGPRSRSIWQRTLSDPRPSAEAKARHGKQWRLSLALDELKLLDESGRIVLVEPSSRAEQIVHIPRPATSADTQHLGIFDQRNNEWLWFRPYPDALRHLENYFDIVVLARGGDEYARMRSAQMRKLVFGLVAFPASIAVAGAIVATSLWLNKTLGFTPFMIAATILVGGATSFVGGLRSISRLRRLKRLHEQLTGGQFAG